ncbi:MAG: hypothetical protein K9K38_14530 [Rhodoferax sp.]|nr:hypothetical protein [Rhodoferax sp.]
MRSIFGIVSLLVVLGIVGVLAKKQLGATREIKLPASVAVPGVSGTPGDAPQTPQQIQQQFKSAAEAALQQPRPGADEK